MKKPKQPYDNYIRDDVKSGTTQISTGIDSRTGSYMTTTYDPTYDVNANAGYGGTIVIQNVEFEEPVLQKIYDKMMKLVKLIEEKSEEFSSDLEYVLRARDVFVKGRGYLNRESFQKLNELWKKYK